MILLLLMGVLIIAVLIMVIAGLIMFAIPILDIAIFALVIWGIWKLFHRKKKEVAPLEEDWKDLQ